MTAACVFFTCTLTPVCYCDLVMSAITLTVRIVAIVLLTWASLRFEFLLPLDRSLQLCGAVYLIVSTVMALVQS